MLGRRKSLWPALVVLALCGLAPSRAHAAEPAPPTLPPPPAPPTSLEVLSSQLVAALFGPGKPPVDGRSFEVVVRFDKPPESGKPDALVAHLGDALEAALRAGHAPGARTTPPAEALERVEVGLTLQAGHLAAIARRRALPRSVWEALADVDGAIVATGFSSAPIDLEVRTLLGIGRRDVKIGELRVVPVGKKSMPALLGAPVLDMAVGDFDGDLHPEVAVLQPDVVRFVRWARGGFSEELGVLSLRTLAPASARLRVPLGRLVPVVRADGRTVLVAASSDRAEPVAIAWGQAGPDRLNTLFQKGWPLYPTGVDRFLVGPWPDGTDVLQGAVTEARFGTAGATWLGTLGRVHDLRGLGLRDLTGAYQKVVTTARAGGELVVDRGARPASWFDAGVVHVWVDFDADGVLEALTTSTAYAGPDRLTLSAGPGKPPRWVGLTAQPITAGVSGDIDRDGFDEVVLATWGGRAGDLIVVVPK